MFFFLKNWKSVLDMWIVKGEDIFGNLPSIGRVRETGIYPGMKPELFNMYFSVITVNVKVQRSRYKGQGSIELWQSYIRSIYHIIPLPGNCYAGLFIQCQRKILANQCRAKLHSKCQQIYSPVPLTWRRVIPIFSDFPEFYRAKLV